MLENSLDYQEVFDNISACMFVVDVTGDGRFRFVGFNRAEEEAIGFSTEQVAGRFVEDIFRAEIAHQLINSYKRAVESGKPIYFDSDLDLPAGRRSFHTNLIPLRDAGGKIFRIVGACIDITDFKKAKEEAFARQRLDSLGLLAGGVAHDFGNLLGSVLIETDAAEAHLAKNSPVRKSIDNIRRLARQAGEIVRVLTTYKGQDNLILEAVDIRALVVETVDALQGSLGGRATLRTDLPADLPAIRGNAAQIRQVIMNLLLNAVEAMGQQEGIISLNAFVMRAGPGAAFVRFEVIDSGCGMAEEVQTRIFDPFFTTKSKGRGLGLASVLGIVNSHGGRIEVTSAPGKGSRFAVLLPTTERAPPAERGTGDSPERSQRDKVGTVMLVEDEDLLRHTLAKVLRAKGLRVLEAADGRIALDLFRAKAASVDIVLLDLTLPQVSGRTVFAEMRKIRSDVKVVLTTAYSEERALSEIGDSNSKCLRKPYEVAELCNLIQVLLREGRSVNLPMTGATGSGG